MHWVERQMLRLCTQTSFTSMIEDVPASMMMCVIIVMMMIVNDDDDGDDDGDWLRCCLRK